MADIELIVRIDADVYTRLFDNGIQDNEIAVDDICEMARALRLGKTLPKGMIVAELINELQTMPQNALVYVEGECADKVILENCDGNQYVRIFKAWDTDFVLGSAGLKGDKE